MSEWRDIETAPKDGTPVRLKLPDGDKRQSPVMAWVRGRWRGKMPGILGWVEVGWDEKCAPPTHWQPLEPPRG